LIDTIMQASSFSQLDHEGVMRAWNTIPTARQLFFPPVPHDPEILEGLERSFFGTIRQRNGTYKYTYANRLDDLNSLVAGLLPSDQPLRLMDVAISSGITTLDWANSLDRLGIPYTLTGGDLNIHGYLLSFGKQLNVLVDRMGYALQYDVFGHGFPNPPARRMLPFYLPWILLFKSLIPRDFEQWRLAMAQEAEQDGPGRRIGCRSVTLVSPRLLHNDRIELIEDDLVNNWTIHDRYHALRAANILNRSYFDEPTLIAIIANLRRRLVEGGLLIVCSTTGDQSNRPSATTSNDGTVFTVGGDDGIKVVGRLGQGSAVEDLVLGLQPAAQST